MMLRIHDNVQGQLPVVNVRLSSLVAGEQVRVGALLEQPGHYLEQTQTAGVLQRSAPALILVLVGLERDRISAFRLETEVNLDLVHVGKDDVDELWVANAHCDGQRRANFVLP